MSKSTTLSTDNTDKKTRNKAIPSQILTYVREYALYGMNLYGIPLILPVLAYIQASNNGKRSIVQRNPLNLDAMGTERIGKNGKADYISEKEGFARGCRRWHMKYRKELDTLTGIELIKAIEPKLLETEYDISTLMEA